MILLGLLFCIVYLLLDAAIEAYVLHVGSLWERLGTWDGPQTYERGAACLLILGLAFAGKVIQVHRRNAEERTREGERKFQKLLESAQEGVWLTDARGYTLFVNPRMAEILGYTVPEMMGRRLFEFTDGPEAAAAREALETGRAEIAGVQDFVFLHKRGHRVFTRLTTSTVLDEAGASAGALAFVTDMTAERTAARALRDSEEKYAKAFQNSPDAVTITRLSDGVFLEVNEGFTRLTGHTAGEAVGATSVSLGLYADPAERDRVLRRLAEEGSLREVEVHFRRKDGSPLVATLTATPLQLGAERCVLGTTRDITARKRAEEEVASLARFPSENPYPVLRTDSAGRLLYANEASGPLLEAWARRPGDTVPPPILEVAQTALRTGKVEVLEVSAPPRTYSLAFAPVPGSREVNLYGRDISEQKRADEALRESEARARGLFQAVAGGVVMQDREGRIVDANPAAGEILGLTVEQIKGLSSMDPRWRAIREDGSPMPGTETPVQITLRTGRPVSDVVTGVFNPLRGEYRWLLVNSQPIFDSAGALQAAVATFLDITERRQSQAMIEAALEEKKVLLREVHHRVKNNLQIVSTLLSLQKAKASDPGEFRALTESQSRVRSMALVHEKLYQTGNLARVDFGDYVQDLVAQVFRAYGPDPDRVRFFIDAPDAEFSADRAITCGLIVNELVTNSLKYAFPQDRPGVVGVRLARAGGWELTVEDDGVGLPAGFDYRATGTLGMMLVDTLVQQLHGTLRLDAAPGARVTIAFGEE